MNTDPTSCYYYVCITTGGKASTPPDSDDDSNQHELDDDHPHYANDDPQFHDNDPIFPQNVVNDLPCPQTDRQKGMAAVTKVNPPDMICQRQQSIGAWNKPSALPLGVSVFPAHEFEMIRRPFLILASTLIQHVRP